MKVLFFLALIVLVPFALLFFLQHSLIYHARAYPAGFERSLPVGMRQLSYTTGAGRQLAFYLPPRSGASLPTRLWTAFTGNASVALDWLPLAQRRPNESDAFLLIDYPGYGKSEGVATIASTRASAEQAFGTLASQLQVPPAELEPRLCALGLSLGAAAALDFAARHPVQRIVLIAPFTTLRDVAAAALSRPVSYLLRENYDNRARLAELARRTPPPRIAIFHGTADTLIPLRMGRELADSAPGVVELFPIEGATHDTVTGAALNQIIEWMNR